MIRRAAVAGALALVLGLLGGCAGDDESSIGPLEWKDRPQSFRSRGRSSDRVLVGTVLNSTFRPVRLEAAKLEVRDGSGNVLRSNGQFIGTYAHGLYGGFQRPKRLPPDELSRLGLVITLLPGKTAPFSLSWRLRPDSRGPVTVDYGEGQLVLPEAVRTAG